VAITIGRACMRMFMLLGVVAAALLSVPVPHDAAAAPVPTAAQRMVSVRSSDPFEKAYYYRGAYYPYRYRGVYFHHRYYRHGRWHYY
jgi:hypothetical protein